MAPLRFLKNDQAVSTDAESPVADLPDQAVIESRCVLLPSVNEHEVISGSVIFRELNLHPGEALKKVKPFGE